MYRERINPESHQPKAGTVLFPLPWINSLFEQMALSGVARVSYGQPKPRDRQTGKSSPSKPRPSRLDQTGRHAGVKSVLGCFYNKV